VSFTASCPALFAGEVAFGAPGVPLVVAMGDLEQDGAPDLVLVNFGGSVSLRVNATQEA